LLHVQKRRRTCSETGVTPPLPVLSVILHALLKNVYISRSQTARTSKHDVVHPFCARFRTFFWETRMKVQHTVPSVPRGRVAPPATHYTISIYAVTHISSVIPPRESLSPRKKKRSPHLVPGINPWRRELHLFTRFPPVGTPFHRLAVKRDVKIASSHWKGSN